MSSKGPIAPPDGRERGWQNLAGVDRAVRACIGAGMLAAAWSGAAGGFAAVALLVFGWVPLATGLIGWCPFYSVFGVSSLSYRTEGHGRTG